MRTFAAGSWNKASGLTLIELLLVLLILSLSTGMALSFFSPDLFGSRRDATSSRIVAMVAQARTKAQLTGKPVFLDVDLDENRLRMTEDVPKESTKNQGSPLEMPLRAVQVDGQPISRSGMVRLRFLPSGLTLPSVIWTDDEQGGRTHYIPAFSASVVVEDNIVNLETLKNR